MSRHAAGSIAERVVRLLATVGLLPVAAATLLASLFPDWWVGDLFTHFRIQYLALGVVGLALAAAMRWRWLGLAALIAVAPNILPVWQYFEPPVAAVSPAHAMPAGTVPFRIAAANVFYRNRNYDDIAAWVRAQRADLVVLVEATPALRDALAERLPEAGFIHLVARQGRSGKLLVAARPPAAMRLIDAKQIRSPTPLVTIAKDGARLTVAAVHTEWPMGSERTARRNESLFDLARQMRAATDPMVATGDFNITPFSPVFETLLREAGAQRAAAGRGWLPTWPVFLPVAGIQIDQLVHTRGIVVESLRIGDGLGSDHRWQVADLRVPKPRP